MQIEHVTYLTLLADFVANVGFLALCAIALCNLESCINYKNLLESNDSASKNEVGLLSNSYKARAFSHVLSLVRRQIKI